LSAIDIKNKRRVALKIVLKDDFKGQMLMREFDLLKQLDHPNIVKIYNIIQYQNFLIIAMSLGKETIDEFAKRRLAENQPLTEEECAALSKSSLKALAYIHEEMNIIHRDIKP